MGWAPAQNHLSLMTDCINCQKKQSQGTDCYIFLVGCILFGFPFSMALEYTIVNQLWAVAHVILI